MGEIHFYHRDIQRKLGCDRLEVWILVLMSDSQKPIARFENFETKILLKSDTNETCLASFVCETGSLSQKWA